MARLSVLFAALALLAGCTAFGGAGTATLSDGRVDARGVGVAGGIDAGGPHAAVGTRRVVVE